MRRLLLAAAFLASMGLLTRWTGTFGRLQSWSSYELSWLAIGGVAAAAAFVEGRWWVLVLGPATWLVVWMPAASAEVRGYTLIFGVPVLVVGCAIGVAARKAAGSSRRPRPPGGSDTRPRSPDARSPDSGPVGLDR